MFRGFSAARVAVVLASLAAADAWAATIHVNITNETGVEDGTPAHPFSSIGEGIAAAASGDKVLVAPGAYKETILMKDGVSVVGAGAQTTIIDGQGLQNSVVTFDRTRQSPLLSGFTIKAGHGDQISETGGFPVFAGGGILVLDSSPLIVRNVVTGNSITQGFCLGGGVYIRANASTPQLIENVITGNVARSTNVAGSGDGGGIYIATKTGSVVLDGNLIESNDAVRGGAVFIDNTTTSTVLVERNVLRDNEAKLGGGIYSKAIGGSTTTIVNNVIAENGSPDAGAQGGGIAATALSTGAFSIFHNTLVSNGVPAGNGGALWLDDGLSNLVNVVANNVLASNTALNGGGIDHTAFDGEIRTNDFHDNGGGNLYNAGGSGAVIVGSLLVDPAFASPAQGNYRLQSGSACLDAANPNFDPADDLDGFSRPLDGDGNQTQVSDLGAFEYPGGEVVPVTFLADGDSLSWPTLTGQDSYNLYRGSMARLRSTGVYTQDPGVEPLAARFCGIVSAQVPFTDGFIPPPGPGVFYLATVVIGGEEGPLGANVFGLPRPNDNSCP